MCGLCPAKSSILFKGKCYAMGQYDNLYKTAQWQRLRRNQLTLQPLCQISLSLGEIVAADVVDHIRPHKGNIELFYDPTNLQSLCKHMHDTICQQMELGTYKQAIGLDGWHQDNDYLQKIYKAKKPK